LKVRDREAEKQRRKFTFISPDEIDSLSLDDCIEISNKIIELANELYPKTVGRFSLFSGGSDSVVVLHLTKDIVDYSVHINTGIGIEQTRQFVRNTCKDYGLKLIEQSPPSGSTYEELIMKFGFPGPSQHYLMYNRLKQRALRDVRNMFVTNRKRDLVQYYTGVRYSESSRRKRTTDDIMKEGSIIWVAPIAHWNNKNMADYKRINNLPVNEVSSNLHMSGECLCGAFAKENELSQIEFFYPETAKYIRELEEKVKESGIKRCQWGTPDRYNKKLKKKSGILCESCDEQFIHNL